MYACTKLSLDKCQNRLALAITVSDDNAYDSSQDYINNPKWAFFLEITTDFEKIPMKLLNFMVQDAGEDREDQIKFI